MAVSSIAEIADFVALQDNTITQLDFDGISKILTGFGKRGSVNWARLLFFALIFRSSRHSCFSRMRKIFEMKGYR